MPAFHYVALNQDQKELSGVVEAPDEPKARVKLNELHLSVVSLTPIESFSHDQSKTGKKIFEFEAIDKNGKKVVGTIASDDPLKAYGRLFEEYQLSVLSIFLATLNAEEKETARKTGIDTLREKYEKLAGAAKKQLEEEEQLELAQKAEKKELLEKIDFTLKRVQEFLRQFNAELKPEQRDTIQSYVDQLIRIKDSTNLEHIRTTCEKMLAHIQKQELFINEEQRLKESSKLKVETTELMEQLKSTGLKQEIDIVKTALRWQENAFLRPFAKIILRIFKAHNPEIQKLKSNIKAANHHIREYLKLLILGKTKIMRMEAWESILTLRSEKKRLKMQLKAALIEEEKALGNAQAGPAFADYAGTVFGWILAFYLLSYMIAYPFTIKNFGLKNLRIPDGFYFYHSSLLKGVTVLVFLAYSAFAVRNYWLKRSWGAPLILYPLTLFGFLLIMINLF
ncbi:hypothetical protein HYW83_05230 [Candidatus Peregrinibacteria bacterium]|nr:hypothetical protein [Candidatus Peregrinibacteria bacterium]